MSAHGISPAWGADGDGLPGLTTVVGIFLIETVEISGPVKINITVIQLAEVSGPDKINITVIQSTSLTKSFDAETRNTIDEAVLVTVS